MNIAKLKTALQRMKKKLDETPSLAEEAKRERQERIDYFKSFTPETIRCMSIDTFYLYIAKLWSMIIWGNKKYIADKLIEDNGFDKIKSSLISLLFDNKDIVTRWNNFKKTIKGLGPASISELLSYTNPEEYIIFNSSTVAALNYLEVPNLPKYNSQYTGEKYREICKIGKEIANYMKEEGFQDVSLLAVDYMMWDELPPKTTIDEISTNNNIDRGGSPIQDKSLHNDIRDKVLDIGRFLGFDSQAEVKIATGAVVDAIWEVKIGNMGKTTYVFEVQSNGSIDSLILNLIKAQTNPSVQAIVAVASLTQLEKIKKELPTDIIDNKKLKLWSIDDVTEVHAALSKVTEAINKLALVPDGFNV